MLYSHNPENEKLNLFTIFLNRAVNGDSQYISVVNNVILETHMYAAGLKTAYNINRDIMHIILLLSGLARPYFENLVDNPQQYNKETYEKVLDIISNKEQEALTQSA